MEKRFVEEQRAAAATFVASVSHIPELAARSDVVRLEWGDLAVREGDPQRLEVSLCMTRADMKAYMGSDDRKRYRTEAEAHGLVAGSFVPDLNVVKDNDNTAAVDSDSVRELREHGPGQLGIGGGEG